MSIRTWICSQTSCSHIFSSPNQFPNFFTKMFCLKHQHFIIYSIQIFILFFIHVLFLNSSLTTVVSDICSKLFHYCYSIQNIRELKTVNLLLYERNLNMYKYFIHIGVDTLDLILQQILDSDVWDEETVLGRNDLTCINCVLNGWL